jgi:DHA1 family tetracycline resistance protein-like MFS transporter
MARAAQGRLQSLDGSLRGIADLIGPGLFTLTFAYSIAPGHELPGAPFLFAALLQLAAIALAWRATRAH